jgi:ribosomal protein S1
MREPAPQRRTGPGTGGTAGARDVSPLAGADPDAFLPGRVTAVAAYGAFVEVGGSGVEGLVHISQISDGRVEAVEDVLREGDAVQVRVTDVDVEGGESQFHLKLQLKL